MKKGRDGSAMEDINKGHQIGWRCLPCKTNRIERRTRQRVREKCTFNATDEKNGKWILDQSSTQIMQMECLHQEGIDREEKGAVIVWGEGSPTPSWHPEIVHKVRYHDIDQDEY